MSIAVGDWMTPNPASIEPEASALAALDLMMEGGHRRVPVVDPFGQLIGILTLTDLRAALEEPLSLRKGLDEGARGVVRDWTVAELMTHAPATTTPDATLESAASSMAARRIGCLPVVDAAGKLAGLLSETDALRALVALLALERGARMPQTLARIDTVERRLRAERWRILNRLAELGGRSRARTGRQRDRPRDSGERASEQRDAEFEEVLADLSARRLDALDRGLDRAAQGRLGICDDCGAGIPTARLRALPGTGVCVRCASAGEEGYAQRYAGRPSPPPEFPMSRTGFGGQVYTQQGEGRLLRVTPFGTCGGCGEVEGVYDEDEDAVLCSSSECGLPLTDVVDLAVVQVGEEVISVAPETLRAVDRQPYD